jgi:hypothetical protein
MGARLNECIKNAAPKSILFTKVPLRAAIVIEL